MSSRSTTIAALVLLSFATASASRVKPKAESLAAGSAGDRGSTEVRATTDTLGSNSDLIDCTGSADQPTTGLFSEFRKQHRILVEQENTHGDCVSTSPAGGIEKVQMMADIYHGQKATYEPRFAMVPDITETEWVDTTSQFLSGLADENALWGTDENHASPVTGHDEERLLMSQQKANHEKIVAQNPFMVSGRLLCLAGEGQSKANQSRLEPAEPAKAGKCYIAKGQYCSGAGDRCEPSSTCQPMNQNGLYSYPQSMQGRLENDSVENNAAKDVVARLRANLESRWNIHGGAIQGRLDIDVMSDAVMHFRVQRHACL